MRVSDIDALFERLGRLSEHSRIKAGVSAQWSYTFPGGDTHTYHVLNVRPPEQIQDSLANLLNWIWNTKDYLKKFAVGRGRSGQDVENVVNSDAHFRICADLANLLKHGSLTNSRSGRFPSLQSVRYEMDGAALRGLRIGAFDVAYDVKRPELVSVTVAIEDQFGAPIGEAFEFAGAAIARWEQLYADLSRN